ncbi:MAG: PAS domain S-box protein [Candidatus Kapabacteria bacterium]|nr:PAS domain S-box protein [Candidatus Kapabacteria bacterium]
MKQLIWSKKVILLVLILSGITFGVTLLSTYVDYLTAIGQMKITLVDDAEHEKVLIETLYKNKFSKDTILSILKATNLPERSIGKTGEFDIAELDGDSIDFIVRRNLKGIINIPLKYNEDSDTATPMRMAIKGNSGTYKGTDYKGAKVIAGYSYFAPYKWGIVSKISVAEVSKPFYYSLLYSFIPAIIFVFFGALLFIKITNPMINTIIESEENLSITLNSIGDGVIATDKNGLITNLNPVAEKLCGFSSDEAKGKNIGDVFNIINAETRERSHCMFKKVIESGRVIGLENHTILISKDGREYQIADSAAPIRDKNGKIDGVVIVFSNITEKYEREAALRESEGRWRTIFDLMEEGMALNEFVLDESGEIIDYKIIDINPAFEKITGLKYEQVAGKNAREIYGLTNETIKFLVKQHLNANGSFKTEIFNEKVKKWAMVSASLPIENKFATIFFDITARKLSEKALEESEKKFRLLYENAPLSYQSLDINANLIDINPAWLKSLGYNKEEVIGHHFSEFMTKESANLISDRFANFLEVGEISDYEFEMVRKDGSHLFVNYEGKIGKDETGNFQQTHCIWTDITERKKAEEALKKYTEELEQANRDLKIFNRAAVDRELKMIDLKKEINDLLEHEKYKIG